MWQDCLKRRDAAHNRQQTGFSRRDNTYLR
jgi:hypothetical protein